MIETLLFLVLSIIIGAMYYLSASCIGAVREICDIIPYDLYTRSKEATAIKVCVRKLAHAPSEYLTVIALVAMAVAINKSGFPLYAYMLPAFCFVGYVMKTRRTAFRWIPGVRYIETCVTTSRYAAKTLHDGAECEDPSKFKGFRTFDVVDSEINAWGEIYDDLVKMQLSSRIAAGFLAFIIGIAFVLIALA